jgi:hypothetical protein
MDLILAQATAAELAQVVEGAKAHLAAAKTRHDETLSAVAANEASATSNLIARLTGRGRLHDLEEANLGGAARMEIAQAQHEFPIATNAYNQLVAEAGQAQQRRERGRTAVRAAIVGLLLDAMRGEAIALLEAEAQLEQSRIELDALGILVTQLERELDPSPAVGRPRGRWPDEIREALQPELREKRQLPSAV